MAYIISNKKGHHIWQKQNLVTIMTKQGHYDIFKCSGCGIEGKSASIETIKIDGRYSESKVNLCSAYIRPEISVDTFIVERSPWPNRLPEGTEIIETEPRERLDGVWFIRKDKAILFQEEPDGKFCLLKGEFKKK